MGAGKSMHFDPADLDKYTTPSYYLSRGAFGNVYGPISRQGSELAIKQILFPDGNVTDDYKKSIEAKRVILTSLEHKNLMRIHWIDLTRFPKVMYLVMDFSAGGSLHETLRSLGSENKLPIYVVTNWAKQIAEGMSYLHEKDVVHRDLKSSNIFLMESFDAGNPHAVLTLKIAHLDDIEEYDHTATMTTFVGTLAYMAPEVLKDELFYKASDVWSFGVVMWEMLSGDIPHKGLDPEAIMYKSIYGKLDNLPIEPSFPKDFKLLLNKCWESTHTERIPFHDISSILHRIVVFEFDSDFFNKFTTRTYYISRGASGSVYGSIPWHDKLLSIKQVMFEDGKVTDEFKKDLEVKRGIWTSLQHQHLTRIFCVDLNHLPIVMFIVMEYAAGGSLYKLMRSLGSGNRLPIDVVANWEKQIAEGMLYLHQENIVHRDLKSSNILLMEPISTSYSYTRMTLKIADFDESKSHDHTTVMSAMVGTIVYMAPEVIENYRFSKASDVWSYGIVVWEMLSGEIPHTGLEPRQIMLKSVKGELNNLPLNQSLPEFYKLLLNSELKL